MTKVLQKENCIANASKFATPIDEIETTECNCHSSFFNNSKRRQKRAFNGKAKQTRKRFFFFFLSTYRDPCLCYTKSIVSKSKTVYKSITRHSLTPRKAET